ncbi:hypothetical protein HDU97_000874 [Phlyctochytrium planicorne]|nr:hypothetical protein HDU97_000874 [Phlyctochytrium planicorne]
MLPQELQRVVVTNASKTAILFHDPENNTNQTFSYSQVWTHATVWAALISKRSRHSSSKIRTAIVPLDRSDPRMHLILDDAIPDLIITSGGADDNGVMDRDILAEALERFEKSPEGKGRVESVKGSPVITLTEMLDEVKGTKEDLNPLEWATYGSDDISHIYFTSGSTGRPKGCISTLGALSKYCNAKNSCHNITPSSVVFVASSHTFDPSLGDFVATLVAGATISISPRKSILNSLSKCLANTSTTHLLTTPVLLATVTDPQICATLEVVALGGEMMSLDLVNLWAGRVKLLNTYGVTECCVYQTAAVMKSVDVENECKVLGTRRDIGTEMGDCVIVIMTSSAGSGEDAAGEGVVDADPTRLRRAKNGEVGEIWIGGPQVGVGYLNRPELTSKRFITNPEFGSCFRTGDLARPILSESGKLLGLQYLGRFDTQIKVSGKRVEVEEVEQVLLSFAKPLLLDAVAVVMSSTAKILVAYCVPTDPNLYVAKDYQGNQDAASSCRRNISLLRQFLRLVLKRNLPPHMIPSRFEFMEKLPQTATGKVGRAALSKLEISFERDEMEEDDEAIVDETLQPYLRVVTDAWRQNLNLPDSSFEMSPSMRFDELGGDSIKALLVCRHVAVALGRKLEEGNEISESTTRNGKGKLGVAPLFVNGGLEPVELLKRPRVVDFARFLKDEFDSHTNSTNEANSVKKGSDVKPLGFVEQIRSILYRAAGTGNTPIVECIISSLKVLDADGKDGNIMAILQQHSSTTTPLHCASLNGHAKTASKLIDLGCSVSLKDSNGATALHFACHRGPIELVDLLATAVLALRSRSDPFMMADDEGQTPIHHASRSGAPENVLKRILTFPLPSESGSSKSKKVKNQMPTTANDATLQERLEARDLGGRTPLHWAAMNGHRGVVKVLVDFGADVAVKDLAGEDPVTVAERLARCGAAERGGGVRSSVFGDIARVLGGRGTTKNVSKFIQK